MMRAAAWILSFAGTSAIVLAWAILAAWIAGRVCTDRWIATQYCYWLPTTFTLAGAGALAALGCAARYGAARLSHRAAGRRSGAPLAVLASLIVASAAYAAVFEYRVLSPLPVSGDRAFRVMHWNASSGTGDRWVESLAGHNLDLIVINPASYQQFKPLLDRYQPVATLWRHGFSVLSKHRIVRTAMTELKIEGGLGIDPRENLGTVRSRDPGRALLVELDTKALLGRNLVIWCLDLPSDVSLHRRMVCREAAEAIAAFAGPIDTIEANGSVNREMLTSPGFPPPDLILGDLNTPRGSGSLRALTGDLRGAYDQAGSGGCATWPYRFPLWHIDQMFAASWLRAVRYSDIDLGGGTHRAQFGEFSPVSP